MVVILAVTPTLSLAGALDGHGDAYFDGSTTWSGSTSFTDGANLHGYVDWAVFAPGDFPYSGYTPTLGEMVYAYQVFGMGTDAVSSFSVGLLNPANNIGSFSGLTGDSATSASIVAPPNGKAEWVFLGMDDGIDQGDNSEGLAFSSVKVPQDLFAVVVNGGSFAVAIPVPTPSSTDIPEPVTMALFAAGGAVLLRRKRRP